MRAPEHRVLVLEDDQTDREEVCEVLRSFGYTVRAVATVEDALAAIDEEEFCLFVFDQEVPLNANARALVSGGERVTVAARATDRRRTAGDAHVTPIVALTKYSERAPFVMGLVESGITVFVPKPVIGNLRYFTEKVKGALEAAGRGDHAKCAALAQRHAAQAPMADVAVARLGIDGKVTTSGRTGIEINGVGRDMQDSKLLVVLRAFVAREREVDGWSSRDSLGIGANRATTTVIRETFDGLVPEGFVVLEGDRRGNFRLHAGVVVERIDWDALAVHPDPGVRRVAVERRKGEVGARVASR